MTHLGGPLGKSSQGAGREGAGREGAAGPRASAFIRVRRGSPAGSLN